MNHSAQTAAQTVKTSSTQAAARADMFETLFATICKRQQNANDLTPTQLSYTQNLFKQGILAINGKVSEEADEVIEAAADLAKLSTDAKLSADAKLSTDAKLSAGKPHPPNTPTKTKAQAAARAHLIHELADLCYHVFVLTAHAGLTLDDIKQELLSRHQRH